MVSPQTEDVLFRQHGGIGRITLNRPQALNAITLAMVRAMRAKLTVWANDPAIVALLIAGAGSRGLCAGGDIRALYDSGRAGDGMALDFWREEYQLNALINEYSKPVIALMDGLVMGGGVGVSVHASHRVVTEATRLAMPECGIGFMPDVGGTWILANAPGELGTFAGLTGHRLKAADAIHLGFADRHVARDRLPDLCEALSQAGGDQIDGVIARFAGDPGRADIERQRNAIDCSFCFDAIEDIIAALGNEDSAWSQEILEVLSHKSPTSLKVALRTFRLARLSAGLRACLDREYRFASRVLDEHDFYEGVRAVVIDKDQAPIWRPATIEDVGTEIVERHLAPLGADELRLAGPSPLRLL
jgi:enoyl-CoA hydratase